MEQTAPLTTSRYSLCTMGGDHNHLVTAIEHADELATFLPTINLRGGRFMIVDRRPDRIADPLSQYVPVLDAYEVASFSYARIEVLNGIGRGNGRRAGGQFSANYRFAHANPVTVEQLEEQIERYHQSRLSTLLEASAVS